MKKKGSKKSVPQTTDTAVCEPSLPYLGGLDGLRAIAVSAVVLFHVGITWFPGGFLGVDVFFTISGFLITSLLLVELERSNRISFGDFYRRRVRRLFPALLAVIIASAILIIFVANDAVSSFRRDLLPSLFYVSNWGYIFNRQSYFEFIGRPPMLQHLWSLAVEEQFYIFWPATVIIVWRFFKARGLFIVAMIGALVSTVLMARGSIINSMPLPNEASRLYFGTDTHLMGIMIGAAFAVIYRPGRAKATLRKTLRIAVIIFGTVLLAGIVWSFHGLDEFSNFLYRGGFLLVGLATVIVIYAVSYPGSVLGNIIGAQPLRYIGERSYGIYLWHWPLFVVTRPEIDITWTGVPAILLRIGLLLVLAELSYRFVESPIRRGAIGVWWNKNCEGGSLCMRIWKVSVAFVCIVLVSSILHAAIFRVPVASGMGTTQGTPVNNSSGALPFMNVECDPCGSSEAPGNSTLIARTISKAADVAKKSAPKKNQKEEKVKEEEKDKVAITGVGDSVMLGAASSLNATFKANVYAVVSLSTQNCINKALSLKKQSKLADIVVVHTGNNGPITEGMLRQLLDGLSDRKLVIIFNNKEPRNWAPHNNQLYASIVPEYSNARLIDWVVASKGHPEYFGGDSIHLTKKGADRYAKLIAEAIAEAVK